VTFYERLEAVVALLRRHGRVSYRALVREFDLDDAFLADLKVELIDVQHLARDEDGKVLVWAGEATPAHALPGTPSAAAVPLPGREAERRQVTVMLCDLVASTELAGRFDPEELRDVLRAYQDVADEVVRRFGGVIARYVGDGLLIYFGYPEAHEDDGPRAVRAGLGIVAAVRQLQARLAPTLEPLRGIPLRVRIGLHTGMAVMGAMGDSDHRDDMAAVGDTPNVAARIQGLADPDTVLLTEATYRLLRGAFACEALGPRSLKGIADPVTVYRVVAEQETLEGLAPARLSPLIGRAREVGLLLERWAQVKEGLGQVVLLSGEAGIGKSRLVQALKTHTATEAHLRLECRCSPHHQHTALYALTELLQRALDIERHHAEDERLARLERTLREYGLPAEDAVPFLAPLLGLGLPPDRYPPLALNPDRHRQRTLETVVALVLELAARQPVLLIVEDLHWVDPSTLECLGLLIEQAPTARVLALLTARPDFVSPWASRAHLTPLMLSRLRRSQIEALVTAVAGGKALPDPVVEQVVSKTDGVPLFIEELTKMVLESGLLQERGNRYELAGPLPPLAIPATLQDSLMARLDRLATVKAVAQLAATIGRSFPYALLHAVSSLDERTLRRELAKLLDAELLYQRGTPPHATYTFKHALIQDAAYHALLKSTRQQYHQRIAETLEAKFPEMVATQPELLAHHYTEAGLVAEAVPYWQTAGHQAALRSAYVEAIGHLGKGLEAVGMLPDKPERARRELGLRLALGVALIAVKSWAAPEVGRTYARARELCREVGEPAQLLRTLRGLSAFHWTRAELATARETAEECLDQATRIGDQMAILRARVALGIPLLWIGELARAREHLEQTSVLESLRLASAGVFVQDHVVTARSSGAVLLWLQGYPDQALTSMQAALSTAETLGHPFSLAMALYSSAQLHQLRREGPATDERAHALVSLSTERGFTFWLGTGLTLGGWALVERGQLDEGVAETVRGLATERSTGTEVAQPVGLTVLADSCWKAGRLAEGLEAVARALDIARRTGGRMYEAEMHRVQGELLLKDGRPDAEAAACFQQALDAARQQQARSWELRAATSLARLWQREGKREDARRLLAEIYGWFTEGFDTADLRDARALLDALS
jgi:class 3 adenylate cyclase/predicted ATPase